MIFGVDYYPEHWDTALWVKDADLMQQTGVELEITPVGRDALVFITNEQNPVKKSALQTSALSDNIRLLLSVRYNSSDNLRLADKGRESLDEYCQNILHIMLHFF